MKIIADEKIPFLEGRIPGAELVRLPAPMIGRDAVRDADVLLTRTRTRCDESLLGGSRVKLVATATIGTDHIDLDWCRSAGIEVRNAPGCNAPGVALYVWSSLLRLGFVPKGKKVALVGCGNVGSVVAQWGERLGAEMLVCDPPRKDAGHSDHDYLSLEEVLSMADAVTLHTPLTHSGAYPTFHLLNSESISHLRRGAFLVNAARGEVISSDAVADAIEKGVVAKAAIDTWEHEPNPDTRLLGLADIATTHIAGYSVEGKQRATRMALEALRDATGCPVITDGLAGPYTMPQTLSEEDIMAHYDPLPMTEALKSDPAAFERLRNAYPLHSEI